MIPWAGCIHIFLSTLVLFVLGITAIQALLLASQEWMLKRKQTIGFIRYFPPLEVMETCLFALISIGIALLTLILATSLFFFHPLFDQGLWKKTFLSLLAWFVFLVLLIGRSYFGWRGKLAIHWTLIGVSLVGVIYLETIYFTPVF